MTMSIRKVYSLVCPSFVYEISFDGAVISDKSVSLSQFLEKKRY